MISSQESTSTSFDDPKVTQLSEEEIAKQKRQEALNKDPQYVQTMALINETQAKNKNTLDNISKTIENLNSTLRGVRQTFDNFDKFKDDFGKVMASLGEKIAESFSGAGPVHCRNPKEGDLENTPKVSNVKDVAQEIKSKSHIVVLTGAGQSVASNIPTFRGEGGYWTLRNKEEKISATRFLTHQYFEHTPEEIWRWHHVFRKLKESNKPNISHHALADIQMHYKKQNQKFTLITQNIDGYHIDAYLEALARSEATKPKPSIAANARSTSISKTATTVKSTSTVKSTPKNLSAKPTTTITSKKVEEKKIVEEVKKEPVIKEARFGFSDQVYEIHGSINYMRCDKSCTTDLFPSPKVGCDDDFVPECPNCKGTARPHTLFFDESYVEEYYRRSQIMEEIQTSDCLIVIGTALETNMASIIVAQALTNKKLVIEINPQPCIKYGNVRHLIGGVEKILPELSKALLTSTPQAPITATKGTVTKKFLNPK